MSKWFHQRANRKVTAIILQYSLFHLKTLYIQLAWEQEPLCHLLCRVYKWFVLVDLLLFTLDILIDGCPMLMINMEPSGGWMHTHELIDFTLKMYLFSLATTININ